MHSKIANIHIPRDLCNDPAQALACEWLVTNGLGGFAMGTIAGALTRRYHGLLIAALNPPLGRTLLVTKLDETLTVAGEAHRLYTNVWSSGVEEPAGCRLLRRFESVLGVATWEFAAGGARLIRRIWMEHGRNTTYVQYSLLPGSPPAELSARLLVNHRDYHALTPGARGEFAVSALGGSAADPRGASSPIAGVPDGWSGLRISAAPEAAAAFALAQVTGGRGAPRRPDWTAEHTWFRDFHLSFEASVGYEHREDHLSAGVCVARLAAGETLTFVLSVESDAAAGAADALARCEARARRAIEAWRQQCPSPPQATPAALPHLALAAQQFIVRRSLPDAPDGHTVIAGYPWFTDWGRDTMISLPGLTLCTGRFDVARQILRTWARVVDHGMIPNRFPDAGDHPEYNTADATLWYLWAIAQYVNATGDRSTLAELFPVMAEIVDWHRRGTRYNIGMDDDGLIYAGQDGVNLTWMDAKIGDWVVTPRIGKPIELSALWHAALRSMARFAGDLDRSGDDYLGLAERVRASFGRFWNASAGCCYDVIDGPHGSDDRIQANQVFAVSLESGLLAPLHQKGVVDTLQRELLTWFGLRTLAPRAAHYRGRYEGGLRQRDEAYHQGTAWGWLLGPFVVAHYRVYADAAAARAMLAPILGQLWTHCIGTIAEIFDGDQPHTPRGCAAQAWSVAETMRAWHVTQAGAAVGA